MLTRRHIRVKVLQSIYAFQQSPDTDLEKQEKFLWYSINQMHELYVLLLQLQVELRTYADNYLQKSQKKHLATDQERNPSQNFIENKVVTLIAENKSLSRTLKNKKLDNWKRDDEYVGILFKALREKQWYLDYLALSATTFQDDKEFLVKLYKEVIAPSDKLYEYLEDNRLTWLDDFPIVNTVMVKMLSKLSQKNSEDILIPDLYKDEDDREFALQLLRKVILNDESLAKEIDGKTPNWDQERIAEIDMIILKMGITEFLEFPSIPVRATINEYLEISKEYSTPKSSLFVNGILDKLVKEFTESKKLNKIGRGLK